MVSDGHCQNIISYPLFVHAIRENITGEWTRITWGRRPNVIRVHGQWYFSYCMNKQWITNLSSSGHEYVQKITNIKQVSLRLLMTVLEVNCSAILALRQICTKCSSRLVIRAFSICWNWFLFFPLNFLGGINFKSPGSSFVVVVNRLHFADSKFSLSLEHRQRRRRWTGQILQVFKSLTQTAHHTLSSYCVVICRCAETNYCNRAVWYENFVLPFWWILLSNTKKYFIAWNWQLTNQITVFMSTRW